MNFIFEQIFNEAHFTETSYDNLKEDKDLRELFDKYNEEYFNSELSVDKIGWSSRKSTSRGASCGKDSHGNVWIEINPLLKCYPDLEAFRDLVIHEMIHLMYFDHGTGFQSVMNRLNKTYGLHISIYAEGEILKSLRSYSDEKNNARADKINNNVNKPELQEMYDNLNSSYFDNKLDKKVIIKYLPKSTYKTYSISQVRPDINSDWVMEYKINRNQTEKWLLKAMIYVYCKLVLNLSKKELNFKINELANAIGNKAGYTYNLEDY